MVKFALQPEHGYIPLLVVGLLFVNFWAGTKVSAARKKYNIHYPQMYAEQNDKNSKVFNCVQRAHQNLLENIPMFLALLVFSSALRPLIAAIAGLVRIFGFIFYVNGYTTGDPKRRNRGAFGYLGLLVSVGLTIEVGLRVLRLI